MNETILAASKLLGQKVSAPEFYDPSILVRVPRSENRIQYGINDNNLPFIGYDVWNCYELSFLTERGRPISLVCKLVYRANSKYIVESKSLKLYLNSFNMCRYGRNGAEGTKIVLNTIKADLEELLETTVSVASFNLETGAPPRVPYKKYKNISNYINLDKIDFETFNEDPSLLRIKEVKRPTSIYIKYDCLRSNCRVTNQPDWGDVFIHYKGYTELDLSSLVQYLCSFRKENHFHEECCEMIYKRLWDVLRPDDLYVGCIYTRRGGIDICPCRSSRNVLFDRPMLSLIYPTKKTLKQ